MNLPCFKIFPGNTKLVSPMLRRTQYPSLFQLHIPGLSTVQAIRYPLAVLGGKLHPQLKNLKPFIKVTTFPSLRYMSHVNLIAGFTDCPDNVQGVEAAEEAGERA